MSGPFLVGLNNRNVMFFFNQMPRQLDTHKSGSDDNNVHQVKYSVARSLFE
jgi:hypothetical protein